jgi:hypothetical protein
LSEDLLALRLGRWGSKQRKVKKKEKLSKDRIQRLEALPGWEWDLGKK